MSKSDENNEVRQKGILQYTTVIRNMKFIRNKYALTQAEMAERSNISTQAYADIERGYSVPSIITVFCIATAIGIDVNTLSSDTIIE